ncbi:LysR family transcriptional regulator [Alsobacter sp. SYSU M60028]|uniref:LysR family transcriptional regulator n=1 Tax=Alsobacter ponti TaxID=2962936 RepID=A0ABT1LG96_9HYPH|nr:LysR family transcriptional regulator [Alsobacter ponti]MCP8939981.1 LysR family transcriptional regulator [Alsobacter ponti]
MLDLQPLRVFLRVSELKSFSKAAVAMGLTQPSISRIVKELERTWDGELFHRTGRGVDLTEFGQIAFARTRLLLSEADRFSTELRSHSRKPSGVVSLGLPASLVGDVVPDLVNGLRRDLPDVRLRIYEGFSDQIERWLSEGDIEVGIYSKYREADGDTQGLLVASHLVLAGPSDGPPLPRETPVAELGRYPLILPALPNGLRMAVESAARSRRVSLNVVVDADSIVAQKQVAERCGCYMIKAPHTIVEDAASNRFTSSAIVEPRILRHAVLVTTQQRPLSRAGREVAARATAILRAIPSRIAS